METDDEATVTAGIGWRLRPLITHITPIRPITPISPKKSKVMHYPLITTSFSPEAVILGNGDFPTPAIPLAALANARYVCCCDGAAAGYISRGFVPDAIVGDGDSLSKELKEKYHDILHIVSEQEDNDLTKATRHCLSMGFRSIAYVGATGRREDHTLGNISLIERYRNEMGIDAVMLTDHGYFFAAEGDAEFDTFAGQQVSIFNFSCGKIESSGLKWHSYAYGSWWQGTLNEAEGTGVKFSADGSYLVFFTYDGKNRHGLSCR